MYNEYIQGWRLGSEFGWDEKNISRTKFPNDVLIGKYFDLSPKNF